MHTKVNQWTTNVVVRATAPPRPVRENASSSSARPREAVAPKFKRSPLRPEPTRPSRSRSQEGCLKRLAGLSKPFKYVVTCNFVQKAGAGMHTASTALWDGKVDGKHTVQWENQTIQCIATVYWLAV